jgi:hypothetical protein
MGLFDGLASAATGGILSFIGQEETNRSNEAQARDASVASAKQAEANRDWQKMMSDTAYQRAVKDMEAAGLNPMLAYQNGGASSPSGAVGMAFQAQMGNSLGSAVEGFNRSRSVGADVQQKEADTAVKGTQESLNKTVEEKTRQDERTSAALAESYKADAALKLAQARTTSSQDALNRQLTAASEAQRAKDTALQPLYEVGGKFTRALTDSDSSKAFVRGISSAYDGATKAISIPKRLYDRFFGGSK